MAATDYIESTEGLLDFVVTQLSTYSGWTVAKFPGSDPKALLKFLPELGLPAAVALYSASSYGSRPRREATIIVVVAADFSAATGSVSARALIDTAISLLDEQISGGALFKVVGDRAVDCGSTVAAYAVEFSVQDH